MSSPYTLATNGGISVLMGDASITTRFIFKVDGVPVKFKDAGASVISIVKGSVMVYKRPHPATLHGVAMQVARAVHHRNATVQSIGLGSLVSDVTDEYIIDNLAEYIETL